MVNLRRDEIKGIQINLLGDGNKKDKAKNRTVQSLLNNYTVFVWGTLQELLIDQDLESLSKEDLLKVAIVIVDEMNSLSDKSREAYVMLSHPVAEEEPTNWRSRAVSAEEKLDKMKTYMLEIGKLMEEVSDKL